MGERKPAFYSAKAHTQRVAALSWYRERSPQLEQAFNLALNTALDRVERHPLIGHPYFDAEPAIRRLSLAKPWPYYLIYRVEPAAVIVLLLQHDRQAEPDAEQLV